jgi:hypothetical protein
LFSGPSPGRPAHETGPPCFPLLHAMCADRPLPPLRPRPCRRRAPFPPLRRVMCLPARSPLSFLLCPGHIMRFSHPNFSSAPRSCPGTKWLRPPHHRLASETVAHRPFRPPRHPFRPGTVARRPIRHSIPSPHRAAVHRHNDGAVPARLWPRARPPPVKGPTPVDGQ